MLLTASYLSNNAVMKIIFFIFFILNVFSSTATTLVDTIYINRGVLIAIDGSQFPYLAYNSTPIFQAENTRLMLDAGDTMKLTLVNMDTAAHGFDIKTAGNYKTTIPALSTRNVSFTFLLPGAFIYYDFSEANRYMGLAGMIVVKDKSSSISCFYWNMKEHQKSFNVNVSQGLPVDWSTYYPDYFTINGRSNPKINDDVNARVTGKIGDTIHIYMVNSGQSLHSIHYHGYHSEIIYSSKFPSHVGRLKDTYAIHAMEVVVVELIPDKVGEYPVHDHNLVAVSGGKMYPNGMFLTMLIE
jgi:FtsP/CotA-like multicopper oxidase with cupredoxin domain